jgi:hypothetical protein
MREKKKEQAACAAHPCSDQCDSLQVSFELGNVIDIAGDHDYGRLHHRNFQYIALRCGSEIIVNPVDEGLAGPDATALSDESPGFHDILLCLSSIRSMYGTRKYKSPCIAHRLL